MTAQATKQADEVEERPLLEEFIRDAELQGLTDSTVDLYNSNLRTFLGWIDAEPQSIDHRHLKEFLYYLKNERPGQGGTVGVSESTINTYFSAMNSFYKFLKFEGYVDENLVPEFRDRYLDVGRSGPGSERQLISIKEMATLVHATLNVRDRAIILLLAKTGVRRNELIQIDLSDIDWADQSIQLEPTPKRTNTLVFFDGECSRALERWIRARSDEDPDTDALFSNKFGNRLKRNGVYTAVTKHAEMVGLHDPDSNDIKDRFTPHCCRHWFTTHLRRAGMKREFIQELRGDTRGDAIDIYDHIDKEELRESYIAHIPTLGV